MIQLLLLLLYIFLPFHTTPEQSDSVFNEHFQVGSGYVLPSGDTVPCDTVAAAFPGGATAQWEYISKHVRYPRLAKEKGHQGDVLVMYDVEPDGSVSNVRILKGVEGAPELEEEAIRVVKSFPKHQPATCNGIALRSTMYAAVRYAMQ